MSIKSVFVAISLGISALLTSPGGAGAAILTFDDPASSAILEQSIASESLGGLTFTNTSGAFLSVWYGNSPNGNATQNLIFAGEGGITTITRTGGGLFSLNSLEMVISWYNSNPTETITINGTPITLTTTLTSLALGLTNVSQVQISGLSAGYWSADNIDYSLSGSVPEPATWAMMLIGFAGLSFAARRRRAV